MVGNPHFRKLIREEHPPYEQVFKGTHARPRGGVVVGGINGIRRVHHSFWKWKRIQLSTIQYDKFLKGCG